MVNKKKLVDVAEAVGIGAVMGLSGYGIFRCGVYTGAMSLLNILVNWADGEYPELMNQWVQITKEHPEKLQNMVNYNCSKIEIGTF